MQAVCAELRRDARDRLLVGSALAEAENPLAPVLWREACALATETRACYPPDEAGEGEEEPGGYSRRIEL